MRYQRQTSLAGFGEAKQQRLQNSHVLIVGAGGLGSPAMLYLAGAGVGRITIVDDDVVSLSNLHRQVVHTTAHVGEQKVRSAAEALHSLNPSITVHDVAERLNWDNALRLMADVDVVIDGSDNFATRHIVSAACARAGIPHVWASVLGFDAQLSVFWAGKGPVYEDIFPEPPAPGSIPNCAQAGVLGPLVGIIGSAMAMETIKLLTDLGTPLVGTVGYYDSLVSRWDYIPLHADPAITQRLLAAGPVTAEPCDTTTLSDGDLVIDVRTREEHEEHAIPGSFNIPVEEFQRGALPSAIIDALATDRRVVLYCASGIRSARAVSMLDADGHHGAYSLRGGITAWLEAGEQEARQRPVR